MCPSLRLVLANGRTVGGQPQSGRLPRSYRATPAICSTVSGWFDPSQKLFDVGGQISLCLDGLVPPQTVASYRAAAQTLPTRPHALALRRKGTSVTIFWSASSGATTYGVSAQPAGAATISRIVAARWRGLKLTGIAPSQSLKVAVAGIRYDGILGRARSSTLKPGKAKGGTAGARLSGSLCS
jgi:hypothetical protein